MPITRPPLPEAVIVIVPSAPVFSSSGDAVDPVEWVTTTPCTKRSPDVDWMLLDRFTSSAAVTVTLPLPVTMVLLTCTSPALLPDPLAIRVTSPLPVVMLPGVDKLPPNERKSMLPDVVVKSSAVRDKVAPAHAVRDVVGSSLPVSALRLRLLASWILAKAPVEFRSICPVKSLTALNRSMLPVPPWMAAVDALMLDASPWATPTPRSVRSLLTSPSLMVMFRAARFSRPSVVWISVVLPALTLPVSVRPAVPAPPWSLSTSAPVVMKSPRLSMLLLVTVTTPASPLRVAAEIVLVPGVAWATVPISSLPSTPRATVPAVAERVLRVALLALTISMAVEPALSVVSSPARLMSNVLPPPSMRMAPPTSALPAPSALMTEPLSWVSPSPPRNTLPAAVMSLAPMARALVASPSTFFVRMRTPPSLTTFWVRLRPLVES